MEAGVMSDTLLFAAPLLEADAGVTIPFWAQGATPIEFSSVAPSGMAICDLGRGRRIPVAENLPGGGGVLAKRSDPTKAYQTAMMVRANTRPRITIKDT